MKRQKFNQLYKEEFVAPLSLIGFEEIGRKSLRYTDDERDLRIVNLGGKFSKPGPLRTVICFRHNFLQPLQKTTDDREVFDLREFTRKLTFYEFSVGLIPPVYQARVYDHWGYDNLEFETEPEHKVAAQLKKRSEITAERILPWAMTLTPEKELAQSKASRSRSWYNCRWMKDYEEFIKAKMSDTR